MADKAPTKSKAPKASKSVAGDSASTTPAAPEPLMVNGIPVNAGDTKGGGSAKRQLVTVVPVKSIQVMKGFNPRVNIPDADVEELAGNIKKDGLLTALLVRPSETPGTFELISGEKRLRALGILGWEEVAVCVRADLVGEDLTAKAIAVAENSDDLRKPLNAIEIGRVCKELEENKWTIDAISKATGHHAQKVRRCLTLLAAPDDLQASVAAGTLSVNSALEAAKLSPETRAKLKDQLQGDISAPEIRRLAKQAAKGDAAAPVDGKGANKKTGKARDAALATWQPNRAKQAVIVELSRVLAGVEEKDKTTADYYEMRGALAALLWDRGDVEGYLLPAENSTDAKDIKVNKQFAAIMAAEAKKYKPPAGEEAATEGNGETPAEGEAAGAEAAPKGKGGKKGAAKA